MKRLIYLLSFIFCTVVSTDVQAQLDPTFGDGGRVIMNLSTYGTINDVAVLPDSRIICNGSATGGRLLVRYSGSGLIDSSFATNGIRNDTAAQNMGIMKVQTDGKIVTVNNLYIERCLSNGGVDSGFGVNGKADLGFALILNMYLYFYMSNFALQSNGKIVVVGTDYTGNLIKVARYHPNGNVDSSFGNNGIVTTDINGNGNNQTRLSSVLIQPDGKIVVGGNAGINAISAHAFVVIRYNPDGSLDSSFNNTGLVYANVGDVYSATYGHDLQMQPDGKLLQAGRGGLGIVLVRYNTDGSLDTALNHTGIYSIYGGVNESQHIALMSDGRIIIAGTTYTNQCCLRRIFPNGGIDSSFGENGRILTALSGSINYQSTLGGLYLYNDGRILVGGTTVISAASVTLFLMRYLPDGRQTGIKTPVSKNISLEVFPNPANETVTIIAPSSGKLSITNISGQIITEKQVNGSSVQLDISGYTPGLYFITIKTTEGQAICARFVKK